MRNRIIYIIAILGLALGMAACTTEPQIAENWTLSKVSLEGSVEKISCEEIDSAQRQIQQAVAAVDLDEADQETLSTLGLWKENEFDRLTWEGNPQAPEDAPQHAGVMKRLENRQEACAATPVTPTTSPAITATSSDCKEGGLPLKYDPNENMNVVSDGIQNAQDDLENIKADPRNLAYRAHNLGFWEDPKNWKPLTENEGKCLSREGEKLYAKVEGALTASSTRVDENATAPASYYNTGMSADGPVVNPTPGITGNLDAIVYTLADGTKVIVLKRCGNLALHTAPTRYIKKTIPGSSPPPPPGKGGPPPVTQPPGQPPVTQPPGTTQPPPPPVCPPGTTGKPPVCKDTEAAGPARVVPPQQQPNPLPLRPDHAQPTRPASPLPVYTPPPPPPPVVVPPAQGGPAPIETPRYTPPPETGAPAPSAPETECIPAPGMTSC